MKRISQKSILVTLLVLFFSLLPLISLALEVTYPTIPGAPNINTKVVSMPAYILYWFYFAIYVSGILGLGMMIYGGLLYLTSAGSPARMADAKDKMTNAVIGIVIILASYIILNTINPELVVFKTPGETELQNLGFSLSGIYIYDKEGCSDDANKYQLSSDTPFLNETSVGDNPQSLKIGIDPSFIDKFIFYSEENYGGTSSTVVPCSDDFPCSTENNNNSCKKGCCLNITSLSFSPKSVKIVWKEDLTPGIHIYANQDCTINEPGKDVEVHTGSSSIAMGSPQAFKIISDNNQTYYVVFHKNKDFTGECDIKTLETSSGNEGVYESNCMDFPAGYRSFELFAENDSPQSGEGVALYTDKDFAGNRLPSNVSIVSKNISEDDFQKTATTRIYNFGTNYTITEIDLPKIAIQRTGQGEIKLGIYLSKDNEGWNEVAKPTVSGPESVLTIYPNDATTCQAPPNQTATEVYTQGIYGGSPYIKINKPCDKINFTIFNGALNKSVNFNNCTETYKEKGSGGDFLIKSTNDFSQGECIKMPFPSFFMVISEIKEYLPALSFSVPNIESQWLKLEIDGPGEFISFVNDVTIKYQSVGESFYGGAQGSYDEDYVGNDYNDKIRSIEVSGNYIAILFEHRDFGGKCQVFSSSNSDLKGTYIGTNTSSFKVRAVK